MHRFFFNVDVVPLFHLDVDVLVMIKYNSLPSMVIITQSLVETTCYSIVIRLFSVVFRPNVYYFLCLN